MFSGIWHNTWEYSVEVVRANTKQKSILEAGEIQRRLFSPVVEVPRNDKFTGIKCVIKVVSRDFVRMF